MKLKQLMLGVLPLLLASASARIWTSADGSKTFEADLISYNAATKVVDVERDGVKLSFAVEKLSETDQLWLVENEKKLAKQQEDKAGLAEARASSPILKELKKVERLDGGRMKRAKIGEDVEFILLYYSASW